MIRRSAEKIFEIELPEEDERALSVSNNVGVDQEALLQTRSSLTANTTPQRTQPKPRNYDTRKPVPKHQPVSTATLPRRQCRVQFMVGKKVVHISPEYVSGNTWDKIIAYERSKRGGARVSNGAELIIEDVL
jgi:hypothetical protein